MEYSNKMAPKRPTTRSKRMQLHKRTHFNPTGQPAVTSLRTPMIRIENHKSDVLSCEFHPTGKYFLSSNCDGIVQICDIYGTSDKMMVLEGHKEAVRETHFSRDGYDVYTCSTDKTLGVWDTCRGCRKAKLEGHTSGINCVQGTRRGYPALCSGSNDKTVRIWDIREKKCSLTFHSDAYVTAVCFSELGDYVFSGGVDNDIKIWDIRRREAILKLSGHTDMVTGMSLSPCGQYLLSHSADNTLRIWDMRPYIMTDRGIRCFPTNQQGVNNLLRCAWSQDGAMISAGTAECDVYIWDSNSGEVLHARPGHESNVNDVAFHPKESIIMSASSDTYLFLNEI